MRSLGFIVIVAAGCPRGAADLGDAGSHVGAERGDAGSHLRGESMSHAPSLADGGELTLHADAQTPPAITPPANGDVDGMSLRGGALFATSQIEIRQEISFDEGSAALAPQAQESLRQIAIAVRSSVAAKARVDCHADAKERSPQKLSAARAKAVQRWLVLDGGIDEARVVVAAHGSAEPRASSKTPAGSAANRRCTYGPA